MVEFKYLTQNNDIITYHFDHKKCDGRRMAKLLEVNNDAYLSNVTKTNDDIIKKMTFKPYQIIDSERCASYSMFASTVNRILSQIMTNTNSEQFTIGILVSVRHHLKDTFAQGNY